jgi:hypothetical protein
MVLAPEDGTGVFALSNTGGLTGRDAPSPLASALLRCVLGLPDQAIRAGIPPQPEIWAELCGWYGPDPGPVSNLFVRSLFGAGVEVTVHGGHMTLRALTPVPAMRRDMRLYPDDPNDPELFRGELPEFGMSIRVAFSGRPDDGMTATRLLMDLFSFQKRPDLRNPRRWVNAVAPSAQQRLPSATFRTVAAGGTRRGYPSLLNASASAWVVHLTTAIEAGRTLTRDQELAGRAGRLLDRLCGLAEKMEATGRSRRRTS